MTNLESAGLSDFCLTRMISCTYLVKPGNAQGPSLTFVWWWRDGSLLWAKCAGAITTLREASTSLKFFFGHFPFSFSFFFSFLLVLWVSKSNQKKQHPWLSCVNEELLKVCTCITLSMMKTVVQRQLHVWIGGETVTEATKDCCNYNHITMLIQQSAFFARIFILWQLFIYI